MAGAAGNAVLQHCTKVLFPGMIEYLATVAALMEDPPAQEAHATGVDEILKAFAAFFSSVQEDMRKIINHCAQNKVLTVTPGPRLLGVLLPAMALLLDPSKTTPSLVHVQTIAHILSFATSAPVAFKEATGKMDQAAKETLEVSVRQALGGAGATASQQSARPQISLRSF